MRPFDIQMSKVQVTKAHVANSNYKYLTKFLYTNVSKTFSTNISILDKNIALRHNLTLVYVTKWTPQIFMLENTSSQTTLHYPISLHACHGFFKMDQEQKKTLRWYEVLHVAPYRLVFDQVNF